MSKRLIWSIVLFALAVATIFFGRGLIIGELIGSFFILAALVVWIVPVGAFSSNSQGDVSTPKRLWHPLLGVGLGLIAAAAAALILPPRVFSWVIILVGVIMIVWLFLQRGR